MPHPPAPPPARRAARVAAPAHGETRAALVRAGVAALTEKGFAATGIDEILRAVGVPKGSFYHYFASKQAFGAELIRDYAAYFADMLEQHFGNDLLSPLNRLRAFIADAERGMARHEFRRGCLIGNLGQEMGALPEAFRAQLAEVFADWQARTARCLAEARAAGELPAALDVERAAAFFWIGWEGAVLRAKLERRPEPLRLFARAYLDSLHAVPVPPAPAADAAGPVSRRSV